MLHGTEPVCIGDQLLSKRLQIHCVPLHNFCKSKKALCPETSILAQHVHAPPSPGAEIRLHLNCSLSLHNPELTY